MPYALLFFLLSQAPEGEQQAPRDEWQYLTSYFTVDALGTSPPAPNSGFDSGGNVFDAKVIPGGRVIDVHSLRFGRIPFLRPPTDGVTRDMVACEGQLIRIRTKRVFNWLFILGSAHNGSPIDWIEFQFDDGTKARGPFGMSDWYFPAVYGEETAFKAPIVGRLSSPPSGGANIWLQRTGIPLEKRLVSLRLPNQPKAKIMAMTLGWRAGVSNSAPPPVGTPKPGLVAIFRDIGFPYFGSRAGLSPERLQTAFSQAGIPAALLNARQLADPNVLSPKSYKVLVQPYGNTFPVAAAENLRLYREQGGSMVHLGIPFTHPVERTPYESWRDLGHAGDYAGHEKPNSMGTGSFRNATWTQLVAEPLLVQWGLGDVAWDRFLPREADLIPHQGYFPQVLDTKSLIEGSDVLPLLRLESVEGGPFAAVIRQGDAMFPGCVDLWLNTPCIGMEPLEVPLQVATELVVRGTAWLLHDKKHIEAAQWKAISQPVEARLQRPETLTASFPTSDHDARLPATTSSSKKTSWIDATQLPHHKRVLLASAQGLVHQANGEHAVFLLYEKGMKTELSRYRKEGLVETAKETTQEELLSLVGHRRAVIVDPEIHGSLNLATMLASVQGLLIGYPGLIDEYGLEAVEDLRGRFAHGAAGYAWALSNLWPKMHRSCLAMVAPDVSTFAIRDYLVEQKIFTFWISWGNDQNNRGASRHREDAVACRLLAEAPVCLPVLGWPEANIGANGIELLSRFGKFLVPADGLANASFTSRLAVPSETAPAPTVRRLELSDEKVYAAAVLPVWRNTSDMRSAMQTVGAIPPPERFAGRVVSTLATDLCPAAQSASLKNLAAREAVGSTGLGLVDPETLGTAFPEESAEVRKLFWKLTDARMRRQGARFLVLRTARKGSALEECARLVTSAEAIFVEYERQTGLTPRDAAYMLAGKPIIQTLLQGSTDNLAPTNLAKGPYAKTRPAFLWSWHSYPEKAARVLPSPDVSLVGPLELAELYKQYHTLYGSREETLVSRTAMWSYEDTGTDIGNAWRQPEYDASSWAQGIAELGYGETNEGRPESTIVSFGGDERKKHPCVYFRHTFEAQEPSKYESILLEVLRDDGCVVYLNGEEVVRSNLPEGEISFSAKASSAVSGDAETAWEPFKLGTSQLRKGRNVLAAEVHQSSSTSSDLSFALGLVGVRKPVDRDETEEQTEGEVDSPGAVQSEAANDEASESSPP